MNQNFGKTIGISYDYSDQKTVQMIEEELNKNGLRVWTTYDHMDENFIPSFISMMNSTEYLIVCLSDMYRLSNRCRTELLYATTSGHRVVSWIVHSSTNNRNNDEQIRNHSIETLLKRVSSIEDDTMPITSPPVADLECVDVQIQRRSLVINTNNYTHENDTNLENWTNPDVIAWCQSVNLPGFLKLLENFDGRSVIKLYEFCKQNSIETVSMLNSDLDDECRQDQNTTTRISISEFIRFQIEVEKLLSITSLKNSSMSLSSLKSDVPKKKLKIRVCTIL